MIIYEDYSINIILYIYIYEFWFDNSLYLDYLLFVNLIDLQNQILNIKYCCVDMHPRKLNFVIHELFMLYQCPFYNLGLII